VRIIYLESMGGNIELDIKEMGYAVVFT